MTNQYKYCHITHNGIQLIILWDFHGHENFKIEGFMKTPYFVSDLVAMLPDSMELIQAEGYNINHSEFGEQPHSTGLVDMYPTNHPLMDRQLEIAIDWLDKKDKLIPQDALVYIKETYHNGGTY